MSAPRSRRPVGNRTGAHGANARAAQKAFDQRPRLAKSEAENLQSLTKWHSDVQAIKPGATVPERGKLPMGSAFKIALLIDAENVSYSHIGGIMNELEQLGLVSIRRIYADWTSEDMRGWRPVVLGNGLMPVHQFRTTSGKGNSDSTLIIDAMDILYTKDVDAFCIVSSDADFTRLCTKLREEGKLVLGIGGPTTPTPFIVSCNRFVYFQSLPKAADAPAEDAVAHPPAQPFHPPASKSSFEKHSPASPKPFPKKAAPAPPPAPASSSSGELSALALIDAQTNAGAIVTVVPSLVPMFGSNPNAVLPPKPEAAKPAPFRRALDQAPNEQDVVLLVSRVWEHARDALGWVSVQEMESSTAHLLNGTELLTWIQGKTDYELSIDKLYLRLRAASVPVGPPQAVTGSATRSTPVHESTLVWPVETPAATPTEEAPAPSTTPSESPAEEEPTAVPEPAAEAGADGAEETLDPIVANPPVPDSETSVLDAPVDLEAVAALVASEAASTPEATETVDAAAAPSASEEGEPTAAASSVSP